MLHYVAHDTEATSAWGKQKKLKLEQGTLVGSSKKLCMHFCQLGREHPSASRHTHTAPRSPPPFPFPVAGVPHRPPAPGQLSPTPARRSAPTRRGQARPETPPRSHAGRAALCAQLRGHRGDSRRQREPRPGLRNPFGPHISLPGKLPTPRPSRAPWYPLRAAPRSPAALPFSLAATSSLIYSHFNFFSSNLPPSSSAWCKAAPRLPGRGGGACSAPRALPARRARQPRDAQLPQQPAAAALSVRGRGAGRAPRKPHLPNLRRARGGGRRSRGSAAALNPSSAPQPRLQWSFLRYNSRSPPAGFVTAARPRDFPHPTLFLLSF